MGSKQDASRDGLVVSADATAARQSREMQASIAEATRAATAMENVATATKANASLMQDILYKQMRAYVSVTTGIATYQDEKNKFGSRPVISNTGLSPAKNVTTRVVAQILDTKSVNDFTFPLSDQIVSTDATLSPRQDFTVWGIVKDSFDAEEIKEIMKGETKRLFVWGVVTYDDVFGGHWETHFCHNFNWFTPADGELKFSAWYHKGHNDST